MANVTHSPQALPFAYKGRANAKKTYVNNNFYDTALNNLLE
jgi:hypothetical protein